MERFEDALQGLAISDKRTRQKIAPFLKRFLEASQDLQRALTPLNASVHAAASRANTKPGSTMTNVHWVSVFDRVGLFDVDDDNVARLVDAALRYVWRKEMADALISAVGREGDRIVASSRRRVEGIGEGRGGRAAGEGAADGEDMLGSQMMTLPALRARVALSATRPPVCTPSPAALSSAKAILAAVAQSPHPVALCRDIGSRACAAFQSFLIARAGLTEATLAGGTDTARRGGSVAAVLTATTPAASTSLHTEDAGAGGHAPEGATSATSPPRAIVVPHTRAGDDAGPVASTGTAAAVGATATFAAAAGDGVISTEGNEGRSQEVAADPASPGDGGGKAGGNECRSDGVVADPASPGDCGSNAVGREGPPDGASAATAWAEDGDSNAVANHGAADGAAADLAQDGNGGTHDGADNRAAGGAAADPARDRDGGSHAGADNGAVGGAAADRARNGDVGTHAGADNGAAGGAAADRARDGDVSTHARADNGAAGGAAADPARAGDGGSHAAASSGAADGTLAGLTVAGNVNAAGKSSNLVLGYLVAYLRAKSLPTWKNSRPGKRPAPAGTMANPFGSVTVDKSRSLWCPRVLMTRIKPEFDVPELEGRRFKLANVDDVTVVTAITVFTNKSIAEVISALLVLCTLEPELSRIIDETLAASFEARPPRHQTLVLSGLDLQRRAGEGAHQAGGVSDGGPPSAGVSAVGASPGATDGEEGGGVGAAEVAGGGGDGGVVGASRSAPANGALGRGAVAPSGEGTLEGRRGGVPADGDGIEEGVNTSVEAAYIIRAMLEAASRRASRLAVRRAARTKRANTRSAGAAAGAATLAVLAGSAPPAHGTPSASTGAGAESDPPPSCPTAPRPPAGPRKRRGPTGGGTTQSASKRPNTGAVAVSPAGASAVREEPATRARSSATTRTQPSAGPSARTMTSPSARPLGRTGATDCAATAEGGGEAGGAGCEGTADMVGGD